MQVSLRTPKTTPTDEKNNDKSTSKAVPLETVGGHKENFSAKDGFLTKKTNHTEGRFYERLMGQKLGLAQFVPQCFMVHHDETAALSKKTDTEVTLENLCQGFAKPLVYDIKLGTKTVSFKELRATGRKKLETLYKDVRMSFIDMLTSTFRRSYRFIGSSDSLDSRFHMGTHPDEMIQHMAKHCGEEDLAKIIHELENLHTYLMSEEGNRFELIGASILIVTEADMAKGDKRPTPKVKLIDFAHSNIAESSSLALDNSVLLTNRRRKTYQQGLQKGVAHLIEDLRQVQEKE